MQEIARHGSKLVDHVNAEVTDETIRLLLCLRCQAQPRRLQGVVEEPPSCGVQSAALEPRSGAVWLEWAVAL